MRDIQFIAWDNKKQMRTNFKLLDNMVYFMDKVTGVWIRDSKYPDRFSLLQYTGLKDKNGKEIYEGDVVNKIGIVSEEKFEIKKDFIEINTPQSGTVLIFTDILYDRKTGYKELFVKENTNGILSKIQNYEVIGNIYENPELLEGN